MEASIYYNTASSLQGPDHRSQGHETFVVFTQIAKWGLCGTGRCIVKLGVVRLVRTKCKDVH